MPILAARVKKRGDLFGQRIHCFSLDVLVIVATLTRQSQIVGCRFSALFHGDNVFDGERGNCVRDRAAAVFAPALRSLDHQTPQFCRDIWARHKTGEGDRVAS